MPKLLSGSLVLTFSFLAVSGSSCFAQVPDHKLAEENTRSQIVGTWRGNSVCAVPNSPCHDESNVYRISEIAGKPGFFSVAGGKIVDGKEILMGTGEWKYDAEKQILEGETSGGQFRFKVDGKKMEGSLTLRNNEVYRRIHLKKD